jgi:hypothetical protein
MLSDNESNARVPGAYLHNVTAEAYHPQTSPGRPILYVKQLVVREPKCGVRLLPVFSSNDQEDGALANWQQGVLELEEQATTSRPPPLRMRAIPDWNAARRHLLLDIQL